MKNETVTYQPLTRKMFEEFVKNLEEAAKLHYEEEKKKLKIRDNNLKALSNKSKELNKEIPDELLIIIYNDWPISSGLFEKYKEWFE